MNPQAPAPTPADDLPVSETARRVGPPLAVVSIIAMTALLVWLALAPTAIAGPLEEAPFTVPGTLVVPPDDDGCLRLVDGAGGTREHCVEELARPGDDGYHYTEAFFDAQGRLVAVREGEGDRRVLHLDPETGEVLETLEDVAYPEPGGFPRPMPEEMPEGELVDPDTGVVTPDEPPAEEYVYVDGDRVLRSSDGQWDPEGDEVVLDLEAPPGYRLDQAVQSPDGAWVVVLTGAGQVAVAPTDGSAAPHVWVELGDDQWLDLFRAIHWDG